MSQPPIHNPKYETLARDELEQLQIERLQSTLNRAYRNVAHYRAAFDAHRVDPQTIRELRALADLPFTTRDDLGKSYPYDMFAVPLRDIVRVHATSAATSNPIVVGYTRNDLHNWTECTARLLAALGVAEHDVVQIALDYNIAPGGFGFHQGAEQLGATVIPTSLTMGVQKQVVIMRDFKTTTLITTPGYALNIATALEQMQLQPQRLQLRLGLFGGERWPDTLRRQLEERLHIVSSDIYGLSDITGPGVAGECHRHDGLHVNEDHFIVEVIDPKTLQSVPPGGEGELVFTTITKEGFPLIRYRTGDISSINIAPCPCGRFFARMARVLRRTDDLILYRGVGFLPSQIEELLAQVEGVSRHYQIVLDRDAGAETLEIRVEMSENTTASDEVKALETLRVQIARRIKASLDMDAKVTFAEPKSLRRAGVERIVDRRLG